MNKTIATNKITSIKENMDNTNNSTEETNQFINESEMSVNSILVKNSTAQNENFSVLNWKQIKKLDDLLNSNVPIHGRGNFPTLNIKLKDFIRNLSRRLKHERVRIRDIRINGGVASNILAEDHNYEFSDIDIVYSCDLLQLESGDGCALINENDSELQHKTNYFTNNSELSFSYCCDVIKQTVFDCLLDYFPNGKNENVCWQHLKDAYVKKMTKIYQANPTESETIPNDSTSLNSTVSRWSLISFCNDQGKNIELKFVDKMKRQFQFSVDAFQIHLDSLLCYYDCQDSLKHQRSNKISSNNNEAQRNEFSENFFPSVLAESKYGNFKEALHHLNSKLIATRSPEEIRGGGLLKYCNLLIRGYKPECDSAKMGSIEKYMCSRFFIDFSDLKEQEYKLNMYLDSHFQNDSSMCVIYLKRLFQIVNTSTVCLMGHERKQTLNLIDSMARQFDAKLKHETGFCSLDTHNNKTSKELNKKNGNSFYNQNKSEKNRFKNSKKSSQQVNSNNNNNQNKSQSLNYSTSSNSSSNSKSNSSVPSIKLEYSANSDMSLRSSISSSASLSTSTSPSLSASHSPSHSPIQSPSPSPSPASSTTNSRIPSPLETKNNKLIYTNHSSSSPSFSQSSNQPSHTSPTIPVYQCKMSPQSLQRLEVYDGFFPQNFFTNIIRFNTNSNIICNYESNNFNEQTTGGWVSPTK